MKDVLASLYKADREFHEKRAERKAMDAMLSPIGRENWAVCTRMLVHDLIDISETNQEVKKLLSFYHITFHPSGGFTMALPRLKVVEPSTNVKKKVIKKKK